PVVVHGELQRVRRHPLVDAVEAGERLERRLGPGVGEPPHDVTTRDAAPPARVLVRTPQAVRVRKALVESRVEHGQGVTARKLRDGLRERPVERRDAPARELRGRHARVELAQRDPVAVTPVPSSGDRGLRSPGRRKPPHTVEDEGARPDRDRVVTEREQPHPCGAETTLVPRPPGERDGADVVDAARHAHDGPPAYQAGDVLVAQAVVAGLRDGDNATLARRDGEEGRGKLGTTHGCHPTARGALAVGPGRRAVEGDRDDRPVDDRLSLRPPCAYRPSSRSDRRRPHARRVVRQPSATTMAEAMPASCEMLRCQDVMPSASARAATVPVISTCGGPPTTRCTVASCHRMPAGAPSALAIASFAANRAARDAGGRSRSAGVKSFSRSRGVRSRVSMNRATSTTSIPTPLIMRPPYGGPPSMWLWPVRTSGRATSTCSAVRGYSTVTDFARLRGWSTSRPFAVASAIAKICSGTTASSGESSVGDSGTQKISSA